MACGVRLVCQEPPPLGEGATLVPKPPEANPPGEPGETVTAGKRQ